MHIILKKGKESFVKRFHPWIFSGAVKTIEGNPNEGDVVKILSEDMEILGVAHYQKGSITARMLSFEDVEIDFNFWIEKISNALIVRKNIGVADVSHTNCYRLVHGEGDGMPGLIVDIYGTTAVIQAHSAGMYRERYLIADALIKVLDGKIKNVYNKSADTVPFKAGLDPVNAYLIGEKTNDDTIFENKLKFEIDWETGQKTGFFLDQRENRMLLEKYSKEKDVLNMCCYTGGFSAYALRGGAKSIVSVDTSARAIEQTNRNMKINFQDLSQHQAIVGDAFDFMQNIENKFDMIVLDPPAFAKHMDALKNALQAYRRLNALALKQVRKNGLIFTFSCSQVVSKEQFRSSVFAAAVDSGRQVKILHQLTQPADHPVNIYHPEGEYLKGLVLQVE